MDIKNIIELFGGQTKLAEALGVRQSNVAYWNKTGKIPSKWEKPIRDAASSMGIDIDANQQLRPFIFYTSGTAKQSIKVWVRDETVWASQSGIAEIFDTSKQNVSHHISNIFNDQELDELSVVKKYLTTAEDGKEYEVTYYNLDVILAVGYRVSSSKAVQFRRWASATLKDYLIKGYALNDDRLKGGDTPFGKDYFDELLEKIREIRASERRFYQKVTDIYSSCSTDYDPSSQTTRQFFSSVQDKLHFAIHGHTAAELITSRVNADKPHMGLTSWKDPGRIHGFDVTVAKNYMTPDELRKMNRLVSMFLDYAENQAARHIPMSMNDWVEKLDAFLEFNGYQILHGHGGVQSKTAHERARKEFEKFKIKQDKEYKSDYDKFIEETREKLPG